MTRRGAGIAGATLVVLAMLLGTLVTQVGAPGFDLALIRAAARHLADGTARDAAIAAADIGYVKVLGPLTLVVALVLGFVLHNWRGATAVALTTFSAAVLNRFAKEVFDRERPVRGVRGLEDLDQLEIARHIAHGLSMPSGHACASAAFAMSLVLAAPRGKPRRIVAIVAGLFALVVGASRVALRAHWPTDVLAGSMFGAGIALLVACAVGGFHAHAIEDEPAEDAPAAR